MRYFSLILCFFLFVLPVFSQEENKVFEKVEINAGTDQRVWSEHIRRAIDLPDSVKKNIPFGTYKVDVRFIVDVHGNIGQVKAKNDPGFGLARLAEKAVSGYNGSWKPAVQCGRSVKSYQIQPVTFVISPQ